MYDFWTEVWHFHVWGAYDHYVTVAKFFEHFLKRCLFLEPVSLDTCHLIPFDLSSIQDGSNSGYRRWDKLQCSSLVYFSKFLWIRYDGRLALIWFFYQDIDSLYMVAILNLLIFPKIYSSTTNVWHGPKYGLLSSI